MRVEARVADGYHAGVRRQVLGQRLGGGALLADAGPQGPDALQPFHVERRRLAALHRLPPPQGVDQFAPPATTPSRASLPGQALVAACSTRSAPSSSGVCRTGVANVESTTVNGPGSPPPRCR